MRSSGARHPFPPVMYTLYKNEELEATAKLVGIRRVIGKEERSAEPDEGN